MRHLRIVGILLAVGLLAACGNKNKDGEYDRPEQHEVQVIKMPDYRLTDSVSMGGHRYVYEITRKANDSLAMVRDEMDDLHADNVIRLTILRDGKPFFGRSFTKKTFEEELEDEFLKNSILDGIRFLDAEAGKGLTFSLSVSYPDSDMSVPFDLTVSPTGVFTYVKAELLDVEEGDTTYIRDEGV